MKVNEKIFTKLPSFIKSSKNSLKQKYDSLLDCLLSMVKDISKTVLREDLSKILV